MTDICLDDYHSLDRVGRAQHKITALHPDCNHLDLVAQHVALLRRGETIFKPIYDHSDGTFGPPELVAPKRKSARAPLRGRGWRGTQLQE